MRQVAGRGIPVGGRAEAGEEARAAVRRGAPADPEHDARRARVDRGSQQVTGPDRARRDGVALGGGQSRQAGGLCHLDRRPRPIVGP